MLGRLLGWVGLVGLAASALAGPQAYSQRAQTIRAGIVILASAKTSVTAPPQSAAPYALYNLDANTSVKPAGWSFVNPYAPSRVTSDIYARWSAIDSSTPNIGTPITKRNAPYWEVFLSNLTDDSIGNYDLLLVNPYAFASLNPTERERLRRFVDQGGILWIDPAGMSNTIAGIDEFNSFPIPFVQQASNAVGLEQTDVNNILIHSILDVSSSDIDNLDTMLDSNFQPYFLRMPNIGIDYGASGASGLAGGAMIDFLRYQTVSSYNGNPVISLGRIGDGAVVVTARGASLKLNRARNTVVSYAANVNSFTALPPVLDADGLSAAKLAVNMVGMLSQYRQQNGGSRRTGSSAIDLNPPLIMRSFVNDSNYSTNQSLASPTLYKGMLVTTVNGVLKVFDANPVEDLDGDGNPDEGIQDYGLGTSYDEIWESAAGTMTAPLSAPVCCEVPNNVSGPTDEVLVVDATGTLYVFNLEPRNSDGTLSSKPNLGYSIAPPNGASSLDTSVSPSVPLAPTVSEGVAYVTDNYQRNPGVLTGRIWLVDLSTGTKISSTGPFVVGGSNSSVNLPEFTYGTTVGYIPILDNSGGVDKVLYTPFAGNPSQGVTSEGFTSLWLGVKGERPISYDPQGSNTATALQVTTRASQQGGLPIYTGSGSLGVKLTLIDNSGNPFSATQMAAIFKGDVQDLGGGILSFPFQPTVNQLPSTVSGVRIDYTIDWGSNIPGVLSSVERGMVMLPDQASSGSTSPRRVIGPVALSPRGTAYVVAADGSGGGLFGFREQGRGLFNCVSRYELYSKHTVTLNQSNSATLGPVLNDNDGLITWLSNNASPAIASLLNQTMSNFTFSGGPAIRNGQVMVTVSASKKGIPVTVVMALNAEPQAAQLLVGDWPDGTEVLQPDIARSTIAATPEIQTVIPSGSYTYDSTTQVLSFPNLSSVQRGQVQNCLSLSQPIIIRKPGKPDYLVQPDAIGGSVWNPVQWYYVIDGTTPGGGGPLITGNSVFVSGASYLPAILNGSSSFTTTGVLYALNAQIGAGSLHPDPNKPWLNQLWTIDNPTGSSATGDANVLWPQLSSVRSFSDYQIRLNQTVLGGAGVAPSGTAYGVIGGDNALAAWGDQGLYTFSKANFIVCDEGRVIELDPSGNPIWTTDSSVSQGPTNVGSGAAMQPMVRPVRAYALNDNHLLVVDAGANRVASLNTDGIEARSIASFQLDPNVIPQGFVAGEPLTLSGPSDAVYYTSYVNMSGAAGTLVTLGDGENGNSVEMWQHYLIADTGNRRLVEVIDRFYYNPATQAVGGPVTITGSNGIAFPQTGVLLWHTPATFSGKNYAYTSLNRVRVPDSSSVGYHFVYVTGINGTLATAAGTGLSPAGPNSVLDANDGNGSIVIFDPTTPSGVQAINSVTLPSTLGIPFWDQKTGAFDTLAAVDGSTTYARRAGGLHRFAKLNSVTAKVVQVGSGGSAVPEIAIMISDSTGIYEGFYNAVNPTALVLNWYMPNEAYVGIKQTSLGGITVASGTNAVSLKAVYARRLDSGEILIVNGYNGYTLGGGAFPGEVMQVNGTPNAGSSAMNLGFGTASITLDLNGTLPTGTRGILMPVFADRR
ncbi:MAG: hypothetical protein P4L46_12980 [Fimbriimonas sp.]|nr:hypothetical protein [Fimbriimonas sp.]